MLLGPAEGVRGQVGALVGVPAEGADPQVEPGIQAEDGHLQLGQRQEVPGEHRLVHPGQRRQGVERPGRTRQGMPLVGQLLGPQLKFGDDQVEEPLQQAALGIQPVDPQHLGRGGEFGSPVEPPGVLQSAPGHLPEGRVVGAPGDRPPVDQRPVDVPQHQQRCPRSGSHRALPGRLPDAERPAPDPAATHVGEANGTVAPARATMPATPLPDRGFPAPDALTVLMTSAFLLTGMRYRSRLLERQSACRGPVRCL